MVELTCLSNLQGLAKSLEAEKVLLDEPLSKHTTLKIGGPADILYKAESSGDLIKAIRLARGFEIPVFVVGGGSNILVSDLGITGLVVKNRSDRIDIGKRQKRVEKNNVDVTSRWVGSEQGTKHYDFNDLNYEETDVDSVEVSIDSGVDLQVALIKLLNKGVTGLQWFSRIPGTIGGAVFNNVHGGTHTISEFVERVVILSPDGEIRTLQGNELGFEYDKSRFHKSNEVILEVVLNLPLGNVERAKEVSMEWRRRKSVQPMNSAGCVFKNISEDDKAVLGYPTTATGYIVEHVLNMTEYKIGDAMVSPMHHNFIVNNGKATAKDYLGVRNEIVSRARETIGIELEDEIIYIGDFNY